MNAQIANDLQRFGASRLKTLWLDEARASNIDYLDLLQGVALSRGGEKSVAIEAIVEAEHQPLLYVVRSDSMIRNGALSKEMVQRVCFLLSSRGGCGYLALHEPGKLTIYPVSASSHLPAPVVRTAEDPEASGLLTELSASLVEPEDSEQRQANADRLALHQMLFVLLTKTSDQLLQEVPNLNDTDDVLSLVGRALFMRFIIDRGLWSAEGNHRPEACFSTPMLAAQTCRWLDTTFNGELLPLAGGKYNKFFSSLGADSPAFQILSNIMDHAIDGQLKLPLWREVDFAYVPIGLLSEVYERFAHRHVGKSAAAESIHYTPRHIASLMVDQVFGGLPPNLRAQAKCLDPAVGGGISLVLCFRRLVREKWEKDGRPTRKQLRDIIYNNLTGFDINISALRLTALGLYLAALELDPHPNRQGHLDFKPLQGSVLFHARFDHEKHPNQFVLGSLGEKIGPEHRGLYDIVIGNPPWTAWEKGAGPDKGKGAKLNKKVSDMARSIAASRIPMAETSEQKYRLQAISENYINPDHNPDLPFVWRAMEWAKPGAGIIAFALHARLLFKQSESATKARDALFSSLRITGILNGTALRKTPVWASVKPHWCLLFAVNEVPADSQLFYFVSPELDDHLNRKARMRVDFGKARAIEFGMVRNQQTLLKTLFRGTDVDAQVLATVRQCEGIIPLGEYWKELELETGEGYQTVLEDKEGNPRDPETLSDASHLYMLPTLDKESPKGSAIHYDDLRPFPYTRIMFPRRKAIYLAPLLIIPEALDPDRQRGGSLVGTRDTAYSESFYGYSAAKLGLEGNSLIRYLHVLTYSTLFYHFALMTSSKFGVERDTLLKEDVDAFPVIRFKDLSRRQQQESLELSTAIEAGKVDFEELDRWVAQLYRIDDVGIEAMRDAMQISMPYPAAQRRGQAAVTDPQVRAFVSVLNSRLGSLFEFIDQPIEIHTHKIGRSWSFLEITASGISPSQRNTEWMQAIADAEGASVIFIPQPPPSRLVIGMLSQYRYWTPSRARLLAREIIQSHSGVFESHQDATA